MYNLEVSNIRSKKEANVRYIYAGRTPSGGLGNPFVMKSERQRDEVCDQFHTYFHKCLLKDDKYVDILRDIYRLLKHQRVSLQCFCKPKRCHCDTIADFVNSHIK